MTHTRSTPNAIPKAPDTDMNPADFYGLFTPAEYRAIHTLADTDDIVYQFLGILDRARYVSVNDPRVINGLAYLVGVGTVTGARRDGILLGKPV